MKLAFDPASADKVLRVAKAKQLPRAAARTYGVGAAAALRRPGKDPAIITAGPIAKTLTKSDNVDRKAFDRVAPGFADEVLGSRPPRLDDKNQKMLEAVIKGHELAELQTPDLKGLKEFYGHRSPEVLLREHNMLTTLPQEYAPTKEFMQALRRPGEARHLSEHMGVQFGESPRVSRHARKHLTRLWMEGYQKMAHGLEEQLAEQDRLKSRRGSIPSNVQTLMKAASMAAFADEVAKLSSVDEVEVVEAAHKLQKPRPWKTIGQTAALVGAAAPAIDVAGKFTKGFIDTQGSLAARAAGGAKTVGAMTAGDLAAKSLTSGLGGGVIAAAKEGIELHRARKAIHDYLSESKVGSLFGGPPSGPAAPTVKSPTINPTTSLVRSSSNKGQRVGITPIAAKSGVTQSASGDAMNPRRNLGDAMRAYKT